MLDTQYREHVLDKAMAAGKFPQTRRAYYTSMFDRDPKGTEAFLTLLGGVPPHLLGTTPAPDALASADQETVANWTRQLFPETRPQPVVMDGKVVGVGYTTRSAALSAGALNPWHVRTSPPPERAPEPPVGPAAAATFGPGDVDAWSRQLFPEAAREGDPIPLIIECND